MRFVLRFDRREVEAVQRLFADRLDAGRRLVAGRWEHNVVGPAPQIDEDRHWKAHNELSADYTAKVRAYEPRYSFPATNTLPVVA